jgi:hypothetical protein
VQAFLFIPGNMLCKHTCLFGAMRLRRSCICCGQLEAAMSTNHQTQPEVFPPQQYSIHAYAGADSSWCERDEL